MENKLTGFIESPYKILLILSFILYFLILISSFYSRDYNCLNESIIDDDYSFHFIESEYSSNFFWTTGKIWGYNPYFYAGYPAGIFQAIDNHWPMLFQIILNGILNPELAFNLSVFIGLLLLPLIAYLTAKNFNFGKIKINKILTLTIILCYPSPDLRNELN